jgi:Protein of unknown function (DUF2950)
MRYLNITVFVVVELLAGISLHAATSEGRGFASANAAAKALVSAAKNDDVTELIAILGPASKEILTTNDPVADQQMRRKFAARATAKMKLVPDPKEANAQTLLVGKDGWPLPIPIVKVNGKWHFDVEQGKEEILARRIGSNELDAIEVCRGYVEAQNDYAEEDRTGSGVLHYAQKIISSPGEHDGLYWISTGGEDESPIGAIVARAFAEGYTKKRDPYHGYYFKILTAQGPHASEGAMSYLHNGLMTSGFALVAWPSDYRSTGVMTFLVDKTGIVYQKDLGPRTSQIASAYTAYDPDETWTPVSIQAKQSKLSSKSRSVSVR